MCVAFSPEVIYKNAFYSNDGERLTSKLQKRDIANFCYIIEEEIEKISRKNSKYKYVYFDFNRDTLSYFFDAYFGVFTEIGGDVFLNEDLNPDEIVEINSMYDKAILKSLSTAKKRFQECINTR